MHATPVLILLLALALQCQAHGVDQCAVQNCWNYFYMNVGDCRDSVADLNSCIDNAGLCGCQPIDLVGFMDANADAQCGDSQGQLSACESPTARACHQTAMGIMQMLHVQPPPPIAERKASVAAFDSCIDKAIESKESLKGCDYFFPTPGDMFFALSYALVRGWAQGCDDRKELSEACSNFFSLDSINDCNGSRDPVGDLVSCVKDKVKDKPVCLEYASTLSARLTPVKDEACANLQEAKKKIDTACGDKTSRRALVRRFLRLLNDD